LRAAPPADREVQHALNQQEASFYARMETVGGFGGKADQLNGYYFQAGDPDFFNEDLALSFAASERHPGGGETMAAVRQAPRTECGSAPKGGGK
jgi:hypothetical protein